MNTTAINNATLAPSVVRADEFCWQPGCFAVVNDDYTAFYIVHCTALVSLAISFFTSAYILWDAIVVNKRYSKIGHRFPIYLSVFDMCWSTFHSLDHYVILVPQYYPTHPLTDILGASLQIFLVAPATMVAIISASVYMNMFKQWKIDFGRYDWKLFALCLGIPIVMVIIGLPLGVFGPSGYFNYLRQDLEHSLLYNIIWSALPLVINFSITAFCALSIRHEIRCNAAAYKPSATASTAGVSDVSSNKPKSSATQEATIRATRRINMFAIVFLIQWFPMVLFTIAAFSGFGHWLIALTVVVFVNGGGTMNCYAYKQLYGGHQQQIKAAEETIPNQTMTNASSKLTSPRALVKMSNTDHSKGTNMRI